MSICEMYHCQIGNSHFNYSSKSFLLIDLVLFLKTLPHQANFLSIQYIVRILLQSVDPFTANHYLIWWGIELDPIYDFG